MPHQHTALNTLFTTSLPYHPTNTSATTYRGEPPTHPGQLLPRCLMGIYNRMKNVVGAVDKLIEPWNPLTHGAWEWHAEPLVKCSDGLVRRYPISRRKNSDYQCQIQLGAIYDSPAARISQYFGGLTLSACGQRMEFVLNRHIIQPIAVGEGRAYPLSAHRYLVPQVGFGDSAAACIDMLLLDKGKHPLHDIKTGQRSTMGTATTLHDIANELKQLSGLQPITADYLLTYMTDTSPHPSRQAAWRDIARQLELHGPCILNKGRHFVVLDKVRESHGRHYLTLRDPFHGSYLEAEESAEFFRSSGATHYPVKLQVTYLSNTPVATR